MRSLYSSQVLSQYWGAMANSFVTDRSSNMRPGMRRRYGKRVECKSSMPLIYEKVDTGQRLLCIALRDSSGLDYAPMVFNQPRKHRRGRTF